MKKELITEDARLINSSLEKAERARQIINKVLKVHSISSASEIPNRSAIDGYLRNIAIRRDKFLQQLSSSTNLLEVTLPPDLLELKELLIEYHDSKLYESQFIIIKGKNASIDEVALKNYTDKYRAYASTPEQIARLNISHQYIDMLNKLNIQYNQIGRFVNPLVYYADDLNKYVPSVNFVTNGI